MAAPKQIDDISSINGDLTPDIQFINILDTDHGDSSIDKTVENSLHYLSDIGVKHLCLEIPSDFYPVISEFQTEYRKPDSNKESLKNRLNKFFEKNVAHTFNDFNSIIDLISSAAEHDIKVHAVDYDGGAMDLMDKYPKEMEMVFGSSTDADEKISNMPLLDGIWQRIKYTYVDIRYKFSRVDADKQAAESIKKYAQDENGNPERAAVVFGAFHSLKKKILMSISAKIKHCRLRSIQIKNANQRR